MTTCGCRWWDAYLCPMHNINVPPKPTPQSTECSCRGTMRREGAEHGPYLCSQPPIETT